MRIEGLHHAQITIPTGTEEEGRRFYCEIMGLVEIEKPETLQHCGDFWLQVHVGTEDGVERKVRDDPQPANVFNRVVFGGPQTSLNSSTFGVISSQANSPRQMQGGLKLYW